MNKQIIKIFSQKNKKITKFSLGFFKQKNIVNSEKIKLAEGIRSEIKTRIAHRVIGLTKFPICIRDFSQMINVKNLYINSFIKINNFQKINTLQDCELFNNELNSIKKNHTDIPLQISDAVQEYKKYPYFDYKLLNNKLNEFYHARVGIRLLIDYYDFIFSNKNKNFLYCDIDYIIQSAINNAKDLCYQVYGNYIPEPLITKEISTELLYIPSHLYFISFEILKNALRASAENNQDKPIEIEVKETNGHIIFVFRDFGPSVNHNQIKKLFNYTYTTVSHDDNRKRDLIAGYGHGLPLSRLYSRFFGGDLIFVPYHGIKTEVILYLNKNANSFEIEI